MIWIKTWIGGYIDITEEREVGRIFDIGHWTFECPMSNIEYPANFTLLQNRGVLLLIYLSEPLEHIWLANNYIPHKTMNMINYPNQEPRYLTGSLL